MADDEALRSPETLLRHAAAADAAYALELLGRVSGPRLLDLVVTQAELAVDDTGQRRAGVDAVADLARAAVEVMDLPQDADLDLDDDDDDPLAPPTVTGWELVTVEPSELAAATLALPVRAWMLALVAFVDSCAADGTVWRRVVGAAADGRVVAARLRVVDPLDDPDIIGAVVTRDAADLADDAPLAEALRAALTSAGRGV